MTQDKIKKKKLNFDVFYQNFMIFFDAILATMAPYIHEYKGQNNTILRFYGRVFQFGFREKLF
jgi:hypothetical protein